MDGRLVIVGVTGNIGTRIAASMASAGVSVRGVARDPSAVPSNVEPHAADLTDPSQAEKALEGADAVYLTPPEEGEDPLGLERAVSENVIEVAALKGIRHLVVHTALHSDNHSGTGAGIIDGKHAIEHLLAGSGVPFTIFRPGWFLQNLFGAKQWIEQGMVSLPWPAERRIGGVSVADIAAAGVAALNAGPQNRGFDLHVPGGFTGTDLAESASEALGKPVQFQEFSGTPREYVEPWPISDRHKDLYAELFEYFRSADYLGDPSPVGEAFTGFRYTTPAEFMRTELFASG